MTIYKRVASLSNLKPQPRRTLQFSQLSSNQIKQNESVKSMHCLASHADDLWARYAIIILPQNLLKQTAHSLLFVSK